MTDQELAGWARNWHWNDCADDKPVDPSIYFRDMRMLKAFVAKFGIPGPAQARRGSMAAQWTYDAEAEAYYFAPMQAAPPPYLKQRHVDAIIDIAADGTLAGVELIDNMPPPPSPLPSDYRCTCGGDPDQPASHHDISCPMALSSTKGEAPHE